MVPHVPPTSGFVGKFVLFSAAFADGGTGVVAAAVVAGAIAVFFYARVIAVMFFRGPSPGGAVVDRPGPLTATAIAAGAVVTVIAGILPGPLLGLAGRATSFLP